jgi:hypothetical protein
MVPKKAKNCANKSLPEWGKQKHSNEGLAKMAVTNAHLKHLRKSIAIHSDSVW